MPIDTNFPAWLKSPSYGEAAQNALPFAQVGAQLGQNFLSSYYQAQERKQAQALMPLRIAEQKAKLQNLALDYEIQQDKRADFLANKSGYAAMATVLSEIAQKGAWTSPEAQMKFYRLGEKFPSLMETKEWSSAESQFSTAKKAQDMADALQLRLDQQADISYLRDESRTEIAKIKEAGDLKQAEITDARMRALAKENNETKKEVAKLRLEREAKDILPQAEYRAFSELADKIASDPLLSSTEAENQMMSALGRLRARVGKPATNDAAQPQGATSGLPIPLESIRPIR